MLTGIGVLDPEFPFSDVDKTLDLAGDLERDCSPLLSEICNSIHEV